MSPGKTIFILSAACLLTHCQRMEFSEMESSQEGSLEELNILPDKLDLVFVVDTRKGMDPFLQKIFTPRLINHFKDYDLRTAYTNTSVSKAFIEPSPEEKNSSSPSLDNDENPKLCRSGDWLYRIGAIAAGFYLTSPLAFVVGVRGTGKCIGTAYKAASNSVKSLFQGSPPPPVNGQFLLFEGISAPPANYLTTAQEGYEKIWTDTFKTGTAGYNEFDAPQIQKGVSDPLAAVLLSFLREQEVLREGSQKIFVVITSRDTMEAVPFDRIQTVFQTIYEEENTLQIIPVTPMEGISCLKRLKSAGVDRPGYALNLQKSVSDKIQPLNLCAFDLTTRLAEQIKQFVSLPQPEFL